MLTSALETITSVGIAESPLVQSNVTLIKISNQKPDKHYSSSKKNPKEKHVIISTSSESSIDDTNDNEEQTMCAQKQTCSALTVNTRDIYNGLNEIDESNTKEIINDYFFNDNFVYDPNAAPPKALVQKTKKREVDFNDWHDGLCEWQAIHAYPSFKNYVQNFKSKLKNKRNDTIEFDQELGFFVPNFKSKQVLQKPASNSYTNTNTITSISTNANPAQLNTINNPYASNKLIKELNKIASSQYDTNRRSASATSNKRCISIKPAALPFSNSNPNDTTMYNHFQLRSDELDRVRNQSSQKNFRLDYKGLNANVNSKLAQEHSQLNKANQLCLVDDMTKYEEEDLKSKYLMHKSESDSILKNPSFLLNNNHSLNNIGPKVLKVSSLSVNNSSQALTTNEILEKHKFFIDNEYSEQVNNNEVFVNQIYYRSNKNKKHSPLNNKPLIVNTSPKNDGKNSDLEICANSSAPPITGSTTLPPIISGKRINLPLGQHRYL